MEMIHIGANISSNIHVVVVGVTSVTMMDGHSLKFTLSEKLKINRNIICYILTTLAAKNSPIKDH